MPAKATLGSEFPCKTCAARFLAALPPPALQAYIMTLAQAQDKEKGQ